MLPPTALLKPSPRRKKEKDLVNPSRYPSIYLIPLDSQDVIPSQPVPRSHPSGYASSSCSYTLRPQASVCLQINQWSSNFMVKSNDNQELPVLIVYLPSLEGINYAAAAAAAGASLTTPFFNNKFPYSLVSFVATITNALAASS